MVDLSKPGIYAIVNWVSCKSYVGSTVRTLKERWKNHRSTLRRGAHSNPHLQAAWNKYGENAFSLIVLEVIGSRDAIIVREQYWLDEFRLIGDTYNCGAIAANPNLGRVFSAEICQKHSKSMRAAHARGVFDDEWRRRVSEGQKGRRASQETRRRQSEAQKRLWANPLWRLKKSEGMKQVWQDPEYRRRQSEAHQGHKPSEETRRKLSEAGKRQVFSEERKRRISEAKKGHKHSEETKRKIGLKSRGRTHSAKHYPAFVHRETGETIPAGRNLCALCRERGLCQSVMSAVVRGKRGHHKGWVLA